MISYTVELICDQCESVHSGEPSSVPNASDVKFDAHEKGWKIDGDACLCDICADNSKGARELAITDREIDIIRNDFPDKEAA